MNSASKKLTRLLLSDGLDSIRRRLYGSDDEIQTRYGEENEGGMQIRYVFVLRYIVFCDDLGETDFFSPPSYCSSL